MKRDGFTAFIPWFYVPFKTPLRGKEATALEYLRVLAVSRLYLDNFPHLQASWLTPGLKMGQLALFYGCDDMGGVIIEDRVVRDAGANNDATRRDLENVIIGAGFKPVDPRHVLERARRYGARDGVARIKSPTESSPRRELRVPASSKSATSCPGVTARNGSSNRTANVRRQSVALRSAGVAR